MVLRCVRASWATATRCAWLFMVCLWTCGAQLHDVRVVRLDHFSSGIIDGDGQTVPLPANTRRNVAAVSAGFYAALSVARDAGLLHAINLTVETVDTRHRADVVATALVAGELAVHDVSITRQPLESRALVARHELAVVLGVGAENGRQFAFHVERPPEFAKTLVTTPYEREYRFSGA